MEKDMEKDMGHIAVYSVVSKLTYADLNSSNENPITIILGPQ